MSLDIATPLGQKSLADEQVVVEWARSRGYEYIQTPKDKPAAVDGIIVRDGNIIAVVETKSRYFLSHQKFLTVFNNEWLITESKVQRGLKVADALCVKLLGFLYLVDDDTLLTVNLSTALRRVETTETRATINGGVAVRENAFICMDGAKIHRGIKCVSRT